MASHFLRKFPVIYLNFLGQSMPAVSSSKYDVIVIGGGHNGLTNAAYLAKAGKKVLVLERRHILGGAACTEQLIDNSAATTGPVNKHARH